MLNPRVLIITGVAACCLGLAGYGQTHTPQPTPVAYPAIPDTWQTADAHGRFTIRVPTNMALDPLPKSDGTDFGGVCQRPGLRVALAYGSFSTGLASSMYENAEGVRQNKSVKVLPQPKARDDSELRMAQVAVLRCFVMAVPFLFIIALTFARTQDLQHTAMRVIIGSWALWSCYLLARSFVAWLAVSTMSAGNANIPAGAFLPVLLWLSYMGLLLATAGTWLVRADRRNLGLAAHLLLAPALLAFEPDVNRFALALALLYFVVGWFRVQIIIESRGTTSPPQGDNTTAQN